LFEGVLPDSKTLIVAVFVSLLTLVVGWLFYSKRADEFAYYA